jgi:hypothetical protein
VNQQIANPQVRELLCPDSAIMMFEEMTMDNSEGLNMEAITKEADKSSEFFKTLFLSSSLRIGIGMRRTQSNKVVLFLEVLVCICSEEPKFNLSSLEGRLDFLKKLQHRGYLLSTQEDCSVSCERILPREELPAEYEKVRSLSQMLNARPI